MVKYVFFWLSAIVFETGFYLHPCVDKKQEKKGTWWKISHFCTCLTGTNQNRRENNVIFLSQGCIVHVFEMWGSFLLMWNENVAKTGSQIN